MLETLGLVLGAVSTKDVVPVLTHFRIYDGRIQGFNGRIAIDAPLPEMQKLDIVVPAERFLRAVDSCGSREPKLSVADTRLLISCKNFRAKLSLAETTSFPKAEATEGKKLSCKGLLALLEKLLPFVGEDASRAWVCTILLRRGCAWATTNTIIAKCNYADLGTEVALPIFAVTELLRIRKEPQSMTVDERSATFFYEDGSWLRSSLFSDAWPDMEKFEAGLNLETAPLPKGIKDALEVLEPFVKDPAFPVVLLDEEGMHTEDGEHQAEFKGFEFPALRYDLRVLKTVLENATHAHFDSDGPSTFYNEMTGVRGIFAALRK